MSQISKMSCVGWRPDGWSLLALAIATLVVMPILAVIWMALNPTENVWPHLIATTLPRYLSNTVVLMLCVGALTAAIGTGAAWLVVMYRFPGRRWLQWALLLPLAVPGYVGAYALVELLEFAGPVQTALRDTFGWTTPRDYWFPQIRTRGGAIIVLSLSLYPYVYLLARAAFREQSGAGYEVARALGVGPLGRFGRVGLPMARPAIAAGVAVVMMETVNDFGTVDFFAVQTLTTGIFSQWKQGGNLGAAAQISMLVLTMIVVLVLLEKYSRQHARHAGSGRGMRPVSPQELSKRGGIAAFAACALPVALGFGLPLVILLGHAQSADQWTDLGLLRAVANTLTVGGAASLITVLAAVFMVYGARMTGKRLPVLLLPVTAIGYAAPGAVLALGVFVPLAAMNHGVADAVLWITGWDPGLFLTNTAFALGFAYCVRFFAIAQGAADAAQGRVPRSLAMAARSLGRSAGGTLRGVHMPLMRASLSSALLLVFVDCVKELPATLLLKPPGYETLATRVHAKASLENLTEAAPAALAITIVGLIAVALLARANRA